MYLHGLVRARCCGCLRSWLRNWHGRWRRSSRELGRTVLVQVLITIVPSPTETSRHAVPYGRPAKITATDIKSGQVTTPLAKSKGECNEGGYLPNQQNDCEEFDEAVLLVLRHPDNVEDGRTTQEPSEDLQGLTVRAFLQLSGDDPKKHYWEIIGGHSEG